MTELVEANGRTNRRELTRVRLIAAVAELIEEVGYRSISMEEVARRAGVTRRTLYNNFPNRESLIAAVVMRRRASLLPRVEPGQSLRAHLRTLSKSIIDMTTENRGLGRATAAFELFVLSDEDMRRQVLHENQVIYPLLERSLAENFGPDSFGMPLPQFVRVLHAIVDGLLVRRHLMPEEFTDAVVYAAIDSLLPPD